MHQAPEADVYIVLGMDNLICHPEN